MIIKQKSLLVAFISSFVIALSLILTLVGYLAYVELRGEEFRRTYGLLLGKANAKAYSRHIDIPNLSAGINNKGPLKGKPVVEGALKNDGPKDISDILIKVNFLDRDGAILYDAAFHPQDPPLGTSMLPQVAIPYLPGPARPVIKAGSTFPFKAILADCPAEIIIGLKEAEPFAKPSKRSSWSGKLIFEVTSVDFVGA